jgi:hypothetical protein
MNSLLAKSKSLGLRPYWPLMTASWNASWMRLLAFASSVAPNDKSRNWLATSPSFLALNVSPSPFPLANQSIAIPAQLSFENDPLRARWLAWAVWIPFSANFSTVRRLVRTTKFMHHSYAAK